VILIGRVISVIVDLWIQTKLSLGMYEGLICVARLSTDSCGLI
jgi:hypothetical protein